MKKTKLFMSLITCCFALSVLAFGVYAMILDVQFSLSGKIQFEVDNIAQVNNLQVVVKDEDGSVFKTYDETPINKNGSDMSKSKIDQSIGDVKAYANQVVEIHIRVQSLTEKYVKIYLTHNEIADNTSYTFSGVKVRTNSVILAPQSEDGEVKEFIIYVQYINLGTAIQEYTLDNNFVVHFEEMNDILQEDTENGYWYVEMGTIPTITGSEYLRWRYFTSYIEPEENGEVNPKAQYTYEPGVRPTPNSEDGTGCFILETTIKSMANLNSLTYCEYCNISDYINDSEISDQATKYHKTGDLKNVLANDYATSTIRSYLKGIDVNNMGSSYSSNYLKDLGIDNNDFIYSNKINARDIEDLYKNNKVTIDGDPKDSATTIDKYTFSDLDLPKDINNKVLYENDSDKFWLLSFWETYNLLGSQKNNPYKEQDDKLKYSNLCYYLRSADASNSNNVFMINVGMIQNTSTLNAFSYVLARAAFKMSF